MKNAKRSAASPYAPRRRWGNTYDGTKLSTPNLTSPPVVSLNKRGNNSGRNSKKRGGGSNVFPWKAHGSGAARGSRGEGSENDRAGRNNKRGREDGEFGDSRERDDTFFASPGVPRGIGEL